MANCGDELLKYIKTESSFWFWKFNRNSGCGWLYTVCPKYWVDFDILIYFHCQELICYCFLRFSFLQYVVGKIVVSANTIIFFDSWNTGSMQLIEPSKYDFSKLEAARKYFVWKIYLLCFSRSIMTLCLQVSILVTVPLRRRMMVCVSHVLGHTAGTRQEMCMGNRLGQPGGFLHFPLCCKPNYPDFGLFNFGQLYLLGGRSDWNTINQCLNSGLW